MDGKWVGWIRWPWNTVNQWAACCMGNTDEEVWAKLQANELAWITADCCSMPWPTMPNGYPAR